VLTEFHRQITRLALEDHFSTPALETIIKANLRQDGFIFQVGHAHFHFDNNAFSESNSYIKEQHSLVFSDLEKGLPINARKDFGRLSHAVQDLYAHSNYVELWLQKFDPKELPESDAIDPNDQHILENSQLRSGRLYYPLEALSFVPKLRRFVLPLLPLDSHAWMNLDGPASGNKFPFAFSAALKRTRIEFEEVISDMSKEMIYLFTGKGS